MICYADNCSGLYAFWTTRTDQVLYRPVCLTRIARNQLLL